MEFMDVQWIVIAGRFQPGKIQIVVILIFNVEIGGAERHRAIDVNRNVWNFAVILQLPQVVHKSLRAPNGESRNYDGAAAFDHAIYDARKFGSRVAGFVLAIAVSRFAQQNVRSWWRARIVQDWFAIAADVAGKNDHGFLAVLGNCERQAGRAKNVPRVVSLKMKFWREIEAALTWHRLQQLQHRINVFGSVERLVIFRVTAFWISLRALGVFLLQVRGVFQRNGSQFDGGGIGVNRALVAVAHQAGQPSHVVEMRMGQNAIVDGFGIDGKRLKIACAEF